MSNKIERQQVLRKRLERDQSDDMKSETDSDIEHIPSGMTHYEDDAEEVKIEMETVKLDIRKNTHIQTKYI